VALVAAACIFYDCTDLPLRLSAKLLLAKDGSLGDFFGQEAGSAIPVPVNSG